MHLGSAQNPNYMSNANEKAAFFEGIKLKAFHIRLFSKWNENAHIHSWMEILSYYSIWV